MSYLTWHISLSRCSLDIFQNPLFASFCDKLPAQDTIFSKIHVGRKDISILAMQCLTFEILAQGSMTCVIVLQGVVSVCRQSTRKHSDVPKY